MALVDRTSIGRYGMAAIVAAVFTALAVASSGPAWGQDTGDAAEGPAAPEAEAMAPGGMQMMMGAPSDDGDSAALIGHGFLLDKDVFTTIDHPDAVAETGAPGINNRGQIVGGYIDAEGTIHGFLLDDGVFTPIDHPDAGSGPGPEPSPSASTTGARSWASTSMPTEAIHGFLLDKGRGAQRDRASSPPSIIRMAGSGRTTAFGINDRGRIVGSYIDAGGKGHGFVRDKGRGDRRTKASSPPIDFPGAAKTLALGLNNRDQIVGATSMPKERCHGFLLDEGEFTTIDHPDAASGTKRNPGRNRSSSASTTVARSWANTSIPTYAATVSC